MFSITNAPRRLASEEDIEKVINDNTILTEEEKKLKDKIIKLNGEIIKLKDEIDKIDNPAIAADILAIENAQLEITKLTAILRNLRKTDTAGYNLLQGRIDILKGQIEECKKRCITLNIANVGIDNNGGKKKQLADLEKAYEDLRSDISKYE